VSDLIYLYGFVSADAPAPGTELRGIDDAGVALLDIGGVCAVVSQLPADEYNAGVLERRLEDLAWVGAQGVAHERVVLWFVDRADIVPARLFSLYAGAASMRGALAQRAPAIAATIDAFTGLREWNLKVAYDADELAQHGADVSDELRVLDAEIASAAPGKRYLLAKKRADTAKREVARSARRIAREMLEELGTHAVQQRTLPLAGADEMGTVVLSAALLVHRDREAAIRRTAEERSAVLTPLGMIVAFSGPWAPYRFIEDNVDA
jgi:hypothetical protein